MSSLILHSGLIDRHLVMMTVFLIHQAIGQLTLPNGKFRKRDNFWNMVPIDGEYLFFVVSTFVVIALLVLFSTESVRSGGKIINA